MIEAIHKFLNKDVKEVENECFENEYDPTPRIKRTVYPDERLSLNDTFMGAYEDRNKQLNIDYDTKRES